MRLVPQPRDVAAAFVTLPSTDALVPLFRLAQQHAGPNLTAFEFISARALEFLLKHGTTPSPITESSAPCSVLMQVSTAEADRAGPLIEALLSEAMTAALASDVRLAISAAQRSAFWRMREQMSEVQKFEGGSIKHDVSLPVARVPEFLARAADIVERLCSGARPVPFGHLGDGNVHYNVSQPPGMDKARFLSLWEPLSNAIHTLVADMGGSISAEHGIGRMKREELRRLKDPVALDLMHAIKTTFDPNGILNPGKVL
jgi:FAD/FMN-containing dehydrogenase